MKEFIESLEKIREGGRIAAKRAVGGSCVGLNSQQAKMCNAAIDFLASDKTLEDKKSFAAEFCLCAAYFAIEECEKKLLRQLSDIDWELVDKAVEKLK